MADEDLDLAAEEAFQQRSIELTNRYTRELGDFCDKEVPPMIDNREYAARTSSLLIALTRQLARCAAAFGSAQDQDPADVANIVQNMFNNNYGRALSSLNSSEGNTVQ